MEVVVIRCVCRFLSWMAKSHEYKEPIKFGNDSN